MSVCLSSVYLLDSFTDSFIYCFMYSLILSSLGPLSDTSLPWSLAGVADPADLGRCRHSLATKYEAVVAHSCFRFFDCDMHFNYRALNILVRELRGRYGAVCCYCISPLPP